MNLFVKFITLILIMALAAPFVLKDPEGGPLISFQDVQKTDGGFGKGIEKAQTLLGGSIRSIFKSSQASSDIPEGSELQSETESFKVHYWKDENGVFHFSDEKNLNGDSELKTIINDATFVEMDNKALMEKLEEIYNSNPLDENATSANSLSFPDLMSGTFSLKDMLSTFEKAKEVQNVVDANHEVKIKAVESL